MVPPSMFESHSDYPDSVKNNAKAVLKWVDENGWGSCGTDVGKQRANQLANGEPISEETIRRMYSYLSRHEVDLDSSKGYGDGCGKLMYDSWGGKTALSWAEAKVKSFDKKEMSKQVFATDEEKRMVVGPAMIPDINIMRKDDMGNPYYVKFTEETIQKIQEKFMSELRNRDTNLDHENNKNADSFVFESWTVEDPKTDKANTVYNLGVPKGTWMVKMKVLNLEVWKAVKEGKYRGFSIEGNFIDKKDYDAIYDEKDMVEEIMNILRS
jgi:hypothetical protein